MFWKNKKTEEEITNCDAGVDFKKLNAFAIMRRNKFTTEVGFYDEQNKTSVWNIKCNDEKHNKLVEEFLKYKENKMGESNGTP